MILALTVIVAAAIMLPHLLRLERASPATAATLWAAALGLRALAGIFVALYVVLFAPATQVFDALTNWCWHAILPLVATHLGLSGHSLGDTVAIVPSILLGASAAWIAFGIWRASSAVRRLLRHNAIGAGPAGSVVIGGAHVVVAAAGLTRPRLVVSAGALTSLDDEELAASLDHEHGHILRRHRYVMLYAAACRALGRFLPGTSAAVQALQYQLERDADRWALRRAHNPFALASAICKAGLPPDSLGQALSSLSGGDAVRRVDGLVTARTPLRRSTAGLLNALAALGVTLVIALSAAVPLAIAAGTGRVAAGQQISKCRS